MAAHLIDLLSMTYILVWHDGFSLTFRMCLDIAPIMRTALYCLVVA